MGNINLLACGQGRQIPEEDVLKAENMVRVCRMRKQVLGKQHAQLLLQAKEQKEKNPALSMRPIALQLHQMKQQLKKLEEVEMNFINIASISQTTGTLKSITQSYNTARDETENINIDDVLDLQDAIREQQETFAEIDQALSQSCKSHIFLHRYGLVVHFFVFYRDASSDTNRPAALQRRPLVRSRYAPRKASGTRIGSVFRSRNKSGTKKTTADEPDLDERSPFTSLVEGRFAEDHHMQARDRIFATAAAAFCVITVM